MTHTYLVVFKQATAFAPEQIESAAVQIDEGAGALVFVDAVVHGGGRHQPEIPLRFLDHVVELDTGRVVFVATPVQRRG